MHGVELSPASAFVRPCSVAMFHTRASSASSLVGLLIGSRATSLDDWQPAIAMVTVDAVVVHGVSLPIGPWRDLIQAGDLGWPLAGRVRNGQTIAVYVRNDVAQLRELRVVLVVDGGAGVSRGRARLRP